MYIALCYTKFLKPQVNEANIFLVKYSLEKLPTFHNLIADQLTIIPRARMGSESIAHEAEGRMGY